MRALPHNKEYILIKKANKPEDLIMIINGWKNIKFYCMNHETPIPMTVFEGHTSFYNCSRYFLKDDEHPDGHEEGERGCANRLSFTMAVNIVEKISKKIEEDMFGDFTGMKMRYNGIEVKVLEYSMEKGLTKIGINNTNQVRDWR